MRKITEERRDHLSVSFFSCAFLLVSHYGDEVAAAIPLFPDRSVDGGAKRRIDMQTEELSGFSLFSFPRRQPYLVQSDELIAFLPKQGSSPNIPVI